MLDKSIANSLAKLVGLKARLAQSRSITFDQKGQDLTGIPQLQRSFSCIQRSKKAISLSARISGWAPRIMVSTVEPLCPQPTTKTKRRRYLLPVEEDLSIGQLERFIETSALPALGSWSCALRAHTFSASKVAAGWRRLHAKSKRRYAEGEFDKMGQIGSTLVTVAGQIAAVA